MRSKFDEQLKKLNEEMMYMGSMIEESIQKAIEAFIHQDADSAKAIMEGDSEIDREQKKIESLCFNLLMQQQPVARDLRTISAAMKMVTDMERIGDHAADISEMTILMSSDKPYRVNIEHVKSMASETMLMLIRAIEAYVEKNNDKAHIVMKQDDVVDELVKLCLPFSHKKNGLAVQAGRPYMRLEMMVRLHLLQISLNYSDLQMEVYLTSDVAARLFCRVPSGRTTVSDTSLLRFRGVSGLLCLGRLFQGQPNEAALSFL